MKRNSYWSALFQTITTPSYYIEILNRRPWFSIRFFLFSYLLITALMTVGFIVKDIPYYQKGIEESLQKIEREFPNDAQIHWTGERLETNTTEQIEVPYPDFWPLQRPTRQLIAIDPEVKTVGDIANHIPNSSRFVIGERKLFISIPDEGWQETELEKIPLFFEPFALNRQTLPEYLQLTRFSIKEFFTWLPALFPFFYFFGMMPLRFFYILFETLFIFFFLMIVGRKFPFLKLLQITLHIGVVAEIITVLTYFYTIPDMPIFTIAFWVYVTIIFYHLRNVKVVQIKQT